MQVTIVPVTKDDEALAKEILGKIIETGHQNYALGSGFDEEGAFIKVMIHNKENLLFATYEGEVLRAAFWLNRFENMMARIHFSTFGQPETMTKAQLCREAISKMLLLKNTHGGFLFDVFVGCLARGHKHALAVAKGIGAAFHGETPCTGTNPYTWEQEPGVWLSFTRKRLGISEDLEEAPISGLDRKVNALMRERKRRLSLLPGLPHIKTEVQKVYVVTYCRRIESFYGTELVFHSIRTGFPFADITIIDNGSIPEVLPDIRRLSDRANARLVENGESDPHAMILEAIIRNETEPFAIVDPDVIFWDRMDSLEGIDDALIAGRLLPSFKDPYSGCHTYERLHTSMLIIPNPKALREAITEKRADKFEWNPFHGQMFETEKGWTRFDTLGILYASLKDRCKAFDESRLNRYDHLFCGSHLDLVAPSFKDKPILTSHDKAKERRYDELKGVWRQQEEMLISMA